tara:strand:- start:115 stop:540 length:426 start_codon:yes stop_codon:yes gene_type:complete
MDARASEVPIGNNEPTLDVLAEQWLQQKLLEDGHRARRVEIEQQMIPHLTEKPEGSATTETRFGRKITLTNKNNYKLDDVALEEVIETVPANLLPLKIKTTVDVTRLKYLRNNEPDLFHKIARAFISSPAKPAIKIVGGDQ